MPSHPVRVGVLGSRVLRNCPCDFVCDCEAYRLSSIAPGEERTTKSTSPGAICQVLLNSTAR